MGQLVITMPETTGIVRFEDEQTIMPPRIFINVFISQGNRLIANPATQNMAPVEEKQKRLKIEAVIIRAQLPSDVTFNLIQRLGVSHEKTIHVMTEKGDELIQNTLCGFPLKLIDELRKLVKQYNAVFGKPVFEHHVLARKSMAVNGLSFLSLFLLPSDANGDIAFEKRLFGERLIALEEL